MCELHLSPRILLCLLTQCRADAWNLGLAVFFFPATARRGEEEEVVEGRGCRGQLRLSLLPRPVWIHGNENTCRVLNQMPRCNHTVIKTEKRKEKKNNNNKSHGDEHKDIFVDISILLCLCNTQVDVYEIWLVDQLISLCNNCGNVLWQFIQFKKDVRVCLFLLHGRKLLAQGNQCVPKNQKPYLSFQFCGRAYLCKQTPLVNHINDQSSFPKVAQINVRSQTSTPAYPSVWILDDIGGEEASDRLTEVQRLLTARWCKLELVTSDLLAPSFHPVYWKNLPITCCNTTLWRTLYKEKEKQKLFFFLMKMYV